MLRNFINPVAISTFALFSFLTFALTTPAWAEATTTLVVSSTPEYPTIVANDEVIENPSTGNTQKMIGPWFGMALSLNNQHNESISVESIEIFATSSQGDEYIYYPLATEQTIEIPAQEMLTTETYYLDDLFVCAPLRYQIHVTVMYRTSTDPSTLRAAWYDTMTQ